MPEVSVLGPDGESIALREYAEGRPLVIYFYPRDETPGCTAEACGFRDSYQSFVEAGAEVIGISADPPESHARFAQRLGLPFVLASDPNGTARRAFGVARVLGLIDGRETFVFDRERRLRLRFASLLRAAAHVREAVEAVRQLSVSS